MDPLTIIVLITTSATLIIQIVKLIKRSRCGNCVIEMWEHKEPEININKEIEKAIEFYKDIEKNK